jgi:hypothetical protein
MPHTNFHNVGYVLEFCWKGFVRSIGREIRKNEKSLMLHTNFHIAGYVSQVCWIFLPQRVLIFFKKLYLVCHVMDIEKLEHERYR